MFEQRRPCDLGLRFPVWDWEKACEESTWTFVDAVVRSAGLLIRCFSELP